MTNEILQKNLETIAKYTHFILNELLQLDFSQVDGGVAEEFASNGSRDIYFCHDEKKYLLHSSYDPIAEVNRIVHAVNKTKDYLFIVFGMGLGFHLLELKNKISQDTKVVIIEHNIDVVKYVLTHFDLSDIFKSGQFVLLFGDEQQIGKMALYLPALNFYNLVHNIQVFTLPNYYVYGNQNMSALQNISKTLLNTVISFGNALDDQFVGFANMCHNTDAILKSNSVEEIKGKYKNVPAIIVAAGPSLDKNIQYLKEANGKALIIACDASMRACEKHGVQPDAIASIERDEPTYTFYYKDRKFSKDLVLLSPGSIWPNIYEEFEGKTVIMSRNNMGFEQMWLSNFEHFKFVGLGHSCATVAFAAAREAGCNPIILVGQDLAYTSGKKHSDLTHTEYEGENNDRDSTEGVYLEDHEGNLLKSHMVYKIFKEWYEMQILSNRTLQVINATEGGAYIKGTTLMTLKEAISSYCQTPVNKQLVEYLPERIESASTRLEKYEQLIKTLSVDLNLLKKIQKSALSHMNMLIKLEKTISQDCSEKKLETIVLKMQHGNKIIRNIVTADSIEAYFAPIIVPTIMQVKKLGNELTVENVLKNRLLQHNLMFMIVNSTDLIIQEYSNAKAILEKKREQIIAV
ncbi:motility associated factor glycosyltransferase family protein [Sporomusa sp.]|uniref:motility associated factor glycosyltransferase family protein n=1 Tax=Sporomusa sp. TaxID=2078658 RepID=UPI002CDA219C|nr:6-hydroxymethylpterin diphosphokinase MptE-like protein [Sporomusa sp.]HWR45779.1 6-hydroxymethylpterin diphosphokinase MptE-like protein [Sporomusa sp.]